LGGAWVSIKPSQNNIKITTIWNAIGKNRYYSMGTQNCTIINQGGNRIIVEKKNNPSCHTMAIVNQHTVMHHPVDGRYDSVVDDLKLNYCLVSYF
jgi:hypothetical protein